MRQTDYQCEMPGLNLTYHLSHSCYFNAGRYVVSYLRYMVTLASGDGNKKMEMACMILQDAADVKNGSKKKQGRQRQWRLRCTRKKRVGEH